MISIHYLEGSPEPAHPLKGFVASVLIDAAEYYGLAFGASTIRLMDPTPGALHIYQALGFGVVRTSGGLVYCEKEVLR